MFFKICKATSEAYGWFETHASRMLRGGFVGKWFRENATFSYIKTDLELISTFLVAVVIAK